MTNPTNQYLPISTTMPLLNPKYPSQYIQKFTLLKKLIQSQQFTSQANNLAQQLISFNQSNYNCWYVKKMCYLNDVVSFQHQMDFSQDVLYQKVKNFQLWEHRRFLTQVNQKFKQEFRIVDKILQMEYKNYHAWSYRIWLVTNAQNYQQEIEYSYKMILQDPYNNSAWSYRYFLLKKVLSDEQDLKQRSKMGMIQLRQTLKMLQTCLNNESAWSYLRGYFPSIKLAAIPSRNILSPPLFTFQQFDLIQNFIKFQLSKLQKQFQQKDFIPHNYHLEAEVQLLISLVCVESQAQEKVQYARNTCLVLAEKEKQKANYWKWVASNLINKQLQPTINKQA